MYNKSICFRLYVTAIIFHYAKFTLLPLNNIQYTKLKLIRNSQ